MPLGERSRKAVKIKVLLCDDHVLVREGTRRLLEEEPDIEVVGEASDGIEAMEMVKRLSPDVVAMDVSMPRMNGIEATRRIKEDSPGISVLVLTAYDDFAYVSRLIESGASGYILKSARSQELIHAIKATAVGECILDPSVFRQVFSRIARRSAPEQPSQDLLQDPGLHGLTERETEILKLTAKGFSNKEIAFELEVSPRTVQSHLSSVYSKLGVTSRTQAVVAGLQKKIISKSDVEVS